MAVGGNSYGSAAGVAAYVRVYTNAGVFDTTTTPTLAQVEAWVDEVSAIANAALKASGFTVPVSQADSVLMLKGMVQQMVADLCHAARSSGRFFSERALNSNLSAMGMLRREIYDWVTNNADGMESLGASRAASERNEIGFRSTDEAGDETFPIFQRKGFGNNFDNWTS